MVLGLFQNDRLLLPPFPFLSPPPVYIYNIPSPFPTIHSRPLRHLLHSFFFLFPPFISYAHVVTCVCTECQCPSQVSDIVFNHCLQTRIDHASGVPPPLSPSQEPEGYSEMVFTMEDPELGFSLDEAEPGASQIYEQQQTATLVEKASGMYQSEECLLSAGSSDDGVEATVYSTETQWTMYSHQKPVTRDLFTLI